MSGPGVRERPIGHYEAGLGGANHRVSGPEAPERPFGATYCVVTNLVRNVASWRVVLRHGHALFLLVGTQCRPITSTSPLHDPWSERPVFMRVVVVVVVMKSGVRRVPPPNNEIQT